MFIGNDAQQPVVDELLRSRPANGVVLACRGLRGLYASAAAHTSQGPAALRRQCGLQPGSTCCWSAIPPCAAGGSRHLRVPWKAGLVEVRQEAQRRV